MAHCAHCGTYLTGIGVFAPGGLCPRSPKSGHQAATWDETTVSQLDTYFPTRQED